MVYKVKDEATNDFYALKVIYVKNGDLTPNILRELNLLTDIQHNRILRSEKSLLYDSRHICVITKLMKYDLKEVISQQGPISNDTIKEWMKQMLDGIGQLQAMDIIHRDLNPNNILIDVDDNIKIADFGFARSLYNSNLLTPDAGGVRYSALEVLLGAENYGKAADMWSVGCIFSELVTRGTPFDFRQIQIDQSCDHSKSLNNAVLESIFRKLGTPTETMWPGVSSFLRYPQDTSVVHPMQVFDVPSTYDDANGRSMLEELMIFFFYGHDAATKEMFLSD
ncbi:uncharacterized protein LOC141649526 [Silene latifolia]|uniref:uncharacterized protein LOC141649526 n=1 Tax=Silene latifolia TaxID=37657 RepID=UPI003D77F023